MRVKSWVSWIKVLFVCRQDLRVMTTPWLQCKFVHAWRELVLGGPVLALQSLCPGNVGGSHSGGVIARNRVHRQGRGAGPSHDCVPR